MHFLGIILPNCLAELNIIIVNHFVVTPAILDQYFIKIDDVTKMNFNCKPVRSRCAHSYPHDVTPTRTLLPSLIIVKGPAVKLVYN